MSNRIEFNQAIEELAQVHEKFKKRELTSLQHGNQRQDAINKALNCMAKDMGTELEMPLRIDSRGDYSLKTKPLPNGGNRPGFGADFTQALNAAGPRCGMPGTTAVLLETSCWCYLNHFAAEKMVIDYFAHTQENEKSQITRPRE